MSDTTKQVFLYPTARKKNKKGTPTYYHHTWFFVGDLGTSSCILGGSTKCNRTKKHLKSRSTALSVFRPNMSKGPNPSKGFMIFYKLSPKSTRKYQKVSWKKWYIWTTPQPFFSPKVLPKILGNEKVRHVKYLLRFLHTTLPTPLRMKTARGGRRREVHRKTARGDKKKFFSVLEKSRVFELWSLKFPTCT